MKEKLKKEAFYIFNFLYLIWIFICIYGICTNIFQNWKFNAFEIINTVFLCYGFHFFWKYMTK